jgi:uncharacterized protein YjbJ (UPF0337 family)
MSLVKKMKGKKQTLGGRIKLGAGRATGSKRLKARGRTDRLTGNLRLAGQKAMDVFKH